MKWILILGALVAIIWAFRLKKNKSSNVTSNNKNTTKELLKEKAMLDVTRYSKQDESFYSSPEWIELRSEYKKEHPSCETCLEERMDKLTEVVHHITPISQGGKPLDKNNLIALCKKCHSGLHSAGGVRIDLDTLSSLSGWVSIDIDTISSLRDGNRIDPDIWSSFSDLSINIEFPQSWWDEWNKTDHDYQMEEEKIMSKIKNAKFYEHSNPNESIRLYSEAMLEIEGFSNKVKNDPDCKIYSKRYYDAGPWRYRKVRYPIYRYSLVLDRQKMYKECLDAIKKYEQIEDRVGLYKKDEESVRKRKDRMIKKLSQLE